MEDSEPVPDDELTDYENVPLLEDVNNYVAREVLPHVPDAYIDQTYRDETDNEIGIVGFEINFNRYFYEFKPPRALHEIDEDLKAISRSIMLTLEGLAE
jgi:type I restriction enzyme M protein